MRVAFRKFGKLTPLFNGLKSSLFWRKSVLVLGLCVCGILIFCLCILYLLSPVGGTDATEEVRISSGMSATEIGSLLAKKGLIRTPLLFRLASALNGSSRSLQAGEYALNTDMSTFQILRKITSGEAILDRFTIPEGFTLAQIARLWEEREFGVAADFAKASRDPAIRGKYGISSDSLEGYLFPDTYLFPRGISERQAINEMLHQFNNKVSSLVGDEGIARHSADSELALSRHEVISLASIIEKEAKMDDEKPIISAVFHNRLRRGYKLESCATVLYGLGYPDRKLTDEDLKNPGSPYNTYVHKDLPPGPICSPGLVSISAALNPSEDNYLYFVSKNDGTHYFAVKYRDFLNAKRKYQDG